MRRLARVRRRACVLVAVLATIAAAGTNPDTTAAWSQRAGGARRSTSHARAARTKVTVLRPRWRVPYPRDNISSVTADGDHVLVTRGPAFVGDPGWAALIDDRTGGVAALMLPTGCTVAGGEGTPSALGGSWVFAACNLRPPAGAGAEPDELYNLATRVWTPFTPNQTALFATNPNCGPAVGIAGCTLAFAGIGTHWIEFAISCGYHCSPATYAFEDLDNGQVVGGPTGWKAGGSVIPDLDSPGLTLKLCKGVTVPSGFPDPEAPGFFPPGDIALAGPFAVGVDWYQARSGAVDDRYLLQRCGSQLRQTLANGVPSGYRPGVDSTAVVWWGSGSGAIAGIFLPSRKAFEIRNLYLNSTPATGPFAPPIVLSRRAIYALDPSGRLFVAAAPRQPS